MIAAREPVIPPAEPVDPSPEVKREALSRLLYERYKGALLNFVVRLTNGDRQWAEDVVQETVLRAWRNADRLTNSDGGALLPWLVTVARRIVIDDLRGRRGGRPEVTDAALMTIGVGDNTEQTVQRVMIRSALTKLSPAHRTAIVEIYFRGRTVAQLAELSGVPFGTAKSRIYYALRALRQALQDLDDR